MALVFQYGSNCSSARLNSAERLQGDAIPIGLAETVDNYELRFDVWSTGNNCAAADIVPEGDSTVFGVLYEVPDKLIDRNAAPRGRKSFDAIEGNAYERRSIRVKRQDGTVVDAVTYVVRQPARDLRTSIEYVRHIVTGLRENGADEGYITRVKHAAARNNIDVREQIEGL
jgi:cation transport regulator ChaC